MLILPILHGDYQGRKPEEFQDVSFVSGHFGYEFAHQLMEGRFMFTFLRDPIKRVLSLYFYCKKLNPDELEIYKLAQELSLK